MTKTYWLAAAAALSLAACKVANTNEQQSTATGEPTPAGQQTAADKLASVQMQADASYLSSEERKVVNLLIQAADLMNPIYLRQVSADNPNVRDAIAKTGNKALLDRFDTFMGPWDETGEDNPFYGNAARPVGAGFYPAGLTKAQFDDYLTKHPGEAKKLTDAYTVVKRQGDKLVAVPYSAEYKQWLEPAAQKLEQAAAITTNPSLKKFLTLRAKAFRTDDYFESELAWMDLKDTPIEMVIGPYETYTDALYGTKTAFEAFVVLRNPKESSALDVYKPFARDGSQPSGGRTI